MFVKHEFSKGHKVVEDSPHSYCSGGMAYDDGGDVNKQTAASDEGILGWAKHKLGLDAPNNEGAKRTVTNPDTGKTERKTPMQIADEQSQ
jgi:hypothetical protein